VQLARDDVPGLAILLGFALLIAGARVVYVRRAAARHR